MADNIAYPGNPGLPREAREKILSTFRHSLNLFKSGKTEDCAVGCDFILKMDPRFVPARRLLDKARDPNAAVDLAELESYVAETLTPMEKLGAAAPDKLLISAIEAYADRDFDRAIQDSNRVLSVLPGNSDAREILEKATRKRDLQPHVENFRQRALFALEAGQVDEARRNFERMRSLDPEHPEVERLSERLEGSAAPGPAAPPSPETPAFDFPFGEIPEAPQGRPTPEPFAFTPPPAPPPPAGESTGPIALDSLSLDLPPGEDWAPIPDPGASPAPSSEPAAPDASSFADFWSTSAPELALEPPPAGAPDAAAATAGVSDDIRRLLEEGDRLSDRGDYQGAIEVWSRIFLSDLSNPEAASRIENARTRLAEAHRRVSEALKQGRSLYESGQLKEAREKFLEVLAIDETESTARSFLHRIEDDLARPTGSYDLSAAAPGGDVLAEDEGAAAEEGSRAPAAARAVPRRTVPILPVAAVLLAAIGAGLFLMLRQHPAAPPPAPAGRKGPAAPTPIDEATRLFREGKVDEARDTLARIPPESPEYARAQKMLANFGPAVPPPAAESAASGTAAAPPPTAAAQRQNAEAALADHRYIAALTAFHQAAPGYPDDADLKREMALAAGKVQEISPAVRLFNDGDYDSALPILWRLYQADHQNADVKSYLVRCYYNQGVISLQNNLYDRAGKSFDDALGVDPEDALAKRQKAFAQRYLRRPEDLLARVYLKYLRPRP